MELKKTHIVPESCDYNAALVKEMPFTPADSCFVIDAAGTITKWNVTTKDEADSCYTPNLAIPSKIGGQSVKVIFDYTFSANKLTSVIIPYGVTRIGRGAFRDNILMNVTIPSSVMTIGSSAFLYNINLNIIMQGRTSTAGMTLGTGWNEPGTVVFAP